MADNAKIFNQISLGADFFNFYSDSAQSGLAVKLYGRYRITLKCNADCYAFDSFQIADKVELLLGKMKAAWGHLFWLFVTMWTLVVIVLIVFFAILAQGHAATQAQYIYFFSFTIACLVGASIYQGWILKHTDQANF